MSILIKGMEMPQDIREAIIITRGGKASRIRAGRIIIEGSVEETNVAIELPSHGRLIDAEAMNKRLKDAADSEWNKKAGTSWSHAYEEVIAFVEELPTIIEADKDINVLNKAGVEG